MTETLPTQSPDHVPGLAETELRNQAIEASLNPDGALPVVRLSDRYERSSLQSPKSGVDRPNYNVLAEDGRSVGDVQVAVPYGHEADRNPTATVEWVKLGKGEFGKGYGRAIYAAVLKTLPKGFELACDSGGVTPDAKKIWEWLEGRGVASRPSDLGPPILEANGSYKNLGYKTHLREMEAFAATWDNQSHNT